MSLKNFFRETLFGLTDKIAAGGRKPPQPKTLLLVRVDAIGDYVLFRNFIEVIRNKYKDHRIILCGNIVWKNMAVTLDSKYIDDFIWIDKKKMVRDLKYRFGVLKAIHQLRASMTIHPTFSRDYYSGDSIVKASGSPEKIGSVADMGILTESQQLRADKYYTRLIATSANTLFEFERNKQIISQVVQQPVTLTQPTIHVPDIRETDIALPGKFVSICPSASNDVRKWDTANYAELAQFLITEYGYSIVIVGSKDDTELAVKIMVPLDKSKVIDLTGKTSLVELAVVLSKASLVISNDTSAVHIGAAVNAPVICIARGDQFGRFTQYPERDKNKVVTIYPDYIMQRLGDKEYLYENFRYKSKLDINSIRVSDVKKMVVESLKQAHL